MEFMAGIISRNLLVINFGVRSSALPSPFHTVPASLDRDGLQVMIDFNNVRRSQRFVQPPDTRSPRFIDGSLQLSLFLLPAAR